MSMLNSYKITALIAAAGLGNRMNYNINKQFIPINNKPLISHTLEAFDSLDEIDKIVLIIREGEDEIVQSILSRMDLIHPISVVYGGNERQDSIYKALKSVSDDTNIVLTHDGARPFVSRNEILQVIEASILYGAACLMTPMKDTVKISEDGISSKFTPDRSKLFAVQTPQSFSKEILFKAYEQAYAEGYYGTDDCSLVEKTGHSIRLVRGSYNNIKITTQEDLLLAEVIENKLSSKKEKK